MIRNTLHPILVFVHSTFYIIKITPLSYKSGTISYDIKKKVIDFYSIHNLFSERFILFLFHYTPLYKIDLFQELLHDTMQHLLLDIIVYKNKYALQQKQYQY